MISEVNGEAAPYFSIIVCSYLERISGLAWGLSTPYLAVICALNASDPFGLRFVLFPYLCRLVCSRRALTASGWTEALALWIAWKYEVNSP